MNVDIYIYKYIIIIFEICLKHRRTNANIKNEIKQIKLRNFAFSNFKRIL